MSLPVFIWIVGGAAFSILLLVGILYVSSHLGWRTFAVPFRTSNPLPDSGPRFHFVTGAFAWWASYNRCLTAIPARNGVFIRPIPPFFLFHPWLLLPWTELTEREDQRFAGWKRIRLRFQGPNAKHLDIFLPASARKFLPVKSLSQNAPNVP